MFTALEARDGLLFDTKTRYSPVILSSILRNIPYLAVCESTSIVKDELKELLILASSSNHTASTSGPPVDSVYKV